MSNEIESFLAAVGLRPSRSPWVINLRMGTGVDAPTPSYDIKADTRFDLDVRDREWGFMFLHKKKKSLVRVHEGVAFDAGGDDYKLVEQTSSLLRVKDLVRQLEGKHRGTFRRDLALIDAANVPRVKKPLRAWLLA